MVFSIAMRLALLLLAATGVSGNELWLKTVSKPIGSWGGWHENLCPENKPVAVGFYYRFEENQSGDFDDTAGNAIELICCETSKTWAGLCDSVGQSGHVGTWHARVCDTGTHVVAFDQRIESHGTDSNFDDTAHNGIKMMCSNGKILEFAGRWGDWQGWVHCPPEWYVDGVKQQIEASQGAGDDTSLNEVQLRCKSPVIGGIRGVWVRVHTVNVGGKVSQTASIKRTDGKEMTRTESSTIGLMASVKATFGGPIGSEVEVGLELSAEETREVSNTVSTYLEEGLSTTRDVNCLDYPGVRESVYQWVMLSEYSIGAKGINFHSSHWQCNPTNKPPLCSPFICHDTFCRECPQKVNPVAPTGGRRSLSNAPPKAASAFVQLPLVLLAVVAAAVLALGSLGVYMVRRRKNVEGAYAPVADPLLLA